MKKLRILPLLLFLTLAFQVVKGQEIQYPVIKDFGGVYKLEQAKVFPDKNLKNHVLFDITKNAAFQFNLNPGLEHVAMFLNLYALYGIQPGDMEVEAVIHSDAIPLALSDDKYLELTGSTNPNSKLIGELLDQGVKIYVCSQSLMENHYKPEWVRPGLILSAAALNVLVNDQLKGFALLSY